MRIFNKLKTALGLVPTSIDRTANEIAGGIWCAVANVVAVRPYGEGQTETRSGAKHFAANAKVYVVDYYWGMGGDNVTVIGHHRKSHRLVTMVLPSKLLTNWRAQLIYKPGIARRIEENPRWNGISRDKAKIQQIVDGWNRRPPISETGAT